MTQSYGLKQLAADEGYTDEMEMLQDYHMESVVPGICEVCGYSTHVEPDQFSGWCEECEANTVVSCLGLAGII